MIRLGRFVGLVTVFGAVAVVLTVREPGVFLLVASLVLPVLVVWIVRRRLRRQPIGQWLAGAWFLSLASLTALLLPEPLLIPQTPASRAPSTASEAPGSTEILTFTDIVPQTEVAGLPPTATVERCYQAWCEVAGWEFKSNPRPNPTGVSWLKDTVDVRVIWPDGQETILEKDVNLGAVTPARPALLTDRFVQYGTYRGNLLIGDYRFRFTLADGTALELTTPYQGEVIHIPHDVVLDWDGATLRLAWQQEPPTAPLDRYDVLIYPVEQRFPGHIQTFDVIGQVAGGLERGEITIELTDLALQPNRTYVVELSAKAGTAHTGTGQRLTITAEGL